MVTKSRKRTGNSTNIMPPESDTLPYNEDTNDKQKRSQATGVGMRRNLHKVFSIITSISFTLTSITAIICSPLLNEDDLQPILLQGALSYLCILRPLLATLSVCLDGKTHERVIATSFLMTIICNQFPRWASCAVASGAVLMFGLASRQLHQQNEVENNESMNNLQPTSYTPHSNAWVHKWNRLTLKERAALATLLVVLSLLLENFLIWVVSATYSPGIYGSPTPLQDNGRSVLEWMAMKVFDVSNAKLARQSLQFIRDGLNVQWAIVTALGASFICLELQIGNAVGNQRRSLAGLALHALTTLASARFIRTVSFVLTVLPSQVPDCYRRHFPLPPETWKEWLMVGLLPNSRGGCNDLILSGHATVLTTLGCGCTSVANNIQFSMAVWTLVAVDFAIESYQGLHYSVDMWLGCIVTALLWQLTQGLEIPGELDGKRGNTRAEMSHGEQDMSLDGQVVALYALPAILGFVILTFVSEAVVNYFLVGYAVWAGVIMAKWGFTNFSQHILLCLLFVTLGSYL